MALRRWLGAPRCGRSGARGLLGARSGGSRRSRPFGVSEGHGGGAGCAGVPAGGRPARRGGAAAGRGRTHSGERPLLSLLLAPPTPLPRPCPASRRPRRCRRQDPSTAAAAAPAAAPPPRRRPRPRRRPTQQRAPSSRRRAPSGTCPSTPSRCCAPRGWCGWRTRPSLSSSCPWRGARRAWAPTSCRSWKRWGRGQRGGGRAGGGALCLRRRAPIL
jgi:hypothetical protein